MESPTDSNGRLAAFGNQLIEVHIWLREELARLRESVDAHLNGDAARPRELRAHCLTFCTAITRHHTGEDEGAFLVLAKEFPGLQPVLEELRRDHHVVADILQRLEELLDGLEGADPPEAQHVQAELDGLTALLESHFFYEEKQIVTALNSLAPESWSSAHPDFLLTTGTGNVPQAGYHHQHGQKSPHLSPQTSANGP